MRSGAEGPLTGEQGPGPDSTTVEGAAHTEHASETGATPTGATGPAAPTREAAEPTTANTAPSAAVGIGPETEVVPATSAPIPGDVAMVLPPDAAPTPRDRWLGWAGQVVGVVGIVVSLGLIVAVLLGRGWLVDRADEMAGTVDAALARGVTLVDTTSSRVSEVSGRVGAVADAAQALSTNPNPAPGLSEALSAQLQPIQDRYLALRSAYTDVKTSVVSAFDRLQTLDRLLPFFSIPQGPVDALQSLDAQLQAIDAKVSDLFTTPGSGAVNAIAAGVATKASNLQTGLGSVTGSLDDLSARITTVAANVQAKADQVKLMITLGSLVPVVLLLYLAFLHWVLFQAGSRMRRSEAR